MALPVASALSRRDRLWPAVAASVLAHGVLVGWAVARRPPPAIDLEQKPIVAKLVRLGEKRPEQWLPRKEQPPAAAAPAPAAPVAPTAPPVAPAKPAAPSPAAKQPALAPAPAPAVPGRTGGTSLASVLSKVQKQVEEDRYGAPDGDPGGDSATGEGDRYLALVDRALRANYVVPVTISERERLHLEANVILWVEPDGRIARWRQEHPSGNSAFDAAVERTLRVTPRVPPPPENVRESLRKNGIALVFRARDS